MKLWSSWRESSSRSVRRTGAVLAAVAVGLALTAGCLNRPVVKQNPQTSNVFVDQIRQTAIDKIDLLFVIDNSISMADKQQILSVAVPGLVERLVNPDCVQEDEEGNVTARQPAGNAANCPDGWNVEFDPVDDIHIGVITSSLGGHGGEICSPDSPQGNFNETKNDRGRLLPTVRPTENLAADPAGFLAWSPTYPGGKAQLGTDFTSHVVAAGEVGCGYEATLEAWYRFLIDPSPPLDMVNDGSFASPVKNPDGTVQVDQTVLDQRLAFLRPDSLVAVIMLTDENDCSVVDGGIGWLTAQATTATGGFTMPPATSACDTNPNDVCCRSCGLNENSPPSGCSALGADPNCGASRPQGSDSLNLRCYNQKQRFGFDLLYPVERYVAGLSDPTVVDTHDCNAQGECVVKANPLFDVRDASNPRDPSLVFLAGIVGVPWQDIATPETLNSPTELKYQTSIEMTQGNVWSLVVGNPDADNPADPMNLPKDPLMIETPNPRSGTHPVTNQPVAPETSTNPTENAINGHEYVNTDSADLQYACIFPLSSPRDCSTDAGNAACDCTEADIPKNRPLCNPPGGGMAGTMQHFAKAYPGLRLLRALKDFGDNSIVASICPKVIEGSPGDPYFGYNPAVAAIIDRLKEVLGGRCLPRQLVADNETLQVPCAVVEATLTPNDCAKPGRRPVADNVVPAVHKQLEASGSCGGKTTTDCNLYHLCEIVQLTGGEQTLCQTERDYLGAGGVTPGYCYIDRDQMVGDPALLQGCPATEQRKLQFVGEDTPASGSITFIACVGAAFSDDSGNAGI